MTGRRNTLLPYSIFTNQSMAATVTGPVTDVTYLDNLFITLAWTGTPTGTFDFQFSNDQVNGPWFSIPVSPAITAAGVADSAEIAINQLEAPFIRTVFTRTGGTGTLNGKISGKQV